MNLPCSSDLLPGWIKRFWADSLAVGIGVAALVTSCCRRSDRVPMWMDEIASWNLLQDASFTHMIRALGDQAEGVPPLYFTLARGWTAVWPTSELSLRLFTTAAMCAALTMLWAVLRKVFDFWSTVVAVSLVVGTSDTLRFENANVRFYGLMLALIVLSLWAATEIGRRQQPRFRWLAVNSLVQGLLVLCQPLGGFYSAALLVGTVVADRVEYRRWRWRVILSYPVGWLGLLPWWRQLLRQADINHPHSWVAVPGWQDLLTVNGAVAGDFGRLGLFLGVICAAATLIGKQRPPVVESPELVAPALREGATPSRRRLLFLGFALLGMLPFLWIFSRLVPTNSLFVARYLLGASVGWTILVAHLASVALTSLELERCTLRTLLKGTVLLFALWNASVLCGDDKPERFGWLGLSDVAFGHLELPIVCQRGMDYLPRVHYSPQAERYYYLLDWKAATAPNNHYRGSTTEQKLFGGIVRHYASLYHWHILEAEEFLRITPTFLIQDDPQTNWVANRLKPEQYVITRLTPSGSWAALARQTYPILLVERRP